MFVICIKNSISQVVDLEVRQRIRRSIHLDGPITDLVVGQGYQVQATEEWDSGWWLYLHTVPAHDFPIPYPAELFEFHDWTLPAGWEISLQVVRGNTRIKRVTFAAWARDDGFYERLVEGEPNAISTYQRFMVVKGATESDLPI